MTSQETIARIIREFNWANYNMPELVGLSPEDADYADDLAAEIATELNLAQAFDVAAQTPGGPNGPRPWMKDRPLS